MGKKSINLHGHSHGRLKPMPRQFDVGWMREACVRSAWLIFSPIRAVEHFCFTLRERAGSIAVRCEGLRRIRGASMQGDLFGTRPAICLRASATKRVSFRGSSRRHFWRHCRNFPSSLSTFTATRARDGWFHSAGSTTSTPKRSGGSMPSPAASAAPATGGRLCRTAGGGTPAGTGHRIRRRGPDRLAQGQGCVRRCRRDIAAHFLHIQAAPKAGRQMGADLGHSRAGLGISPLRRREIRMGAFHPARRAPALFGHLPGAAFRDYAGGRA